MSVPLIVIFIRYKVMSLLVTDARYRTSFESQIGCGASYIVLKY